MSKIKGGVAIRRTENHRCEKYNHSGEQEGRKYSHGGSLKENYSQFRYQQPVAILDVPEVFKARLGEALRNLV